MDLTGNQDIITCKGIMREKGKFGRDSSEGSCWQVRPGKDVVCYGTLGANWCADHQKPVLGGDKVTIPMKRYKQAW